MDSDLSEQLPTLFWMLSYFSHFAKGQVGPPPDPNADPSVIPTPTFDPRAPGSDTPSSMSYPVYVDISGGFLQPLIWNSFLSTVGAAKMLMCNSIGMWGLFWYNDGGEMTEACLTTGFVGARPLFMN